MAMAIWLALSEACEYSASPCLSYVFDCLACVRSEEAEYI